MPIFYLACLTFLYLFKIPEPLGFSNHLVVYTKVNTKPKLLKLFHSDPDQIFIAWDPLYVDFFDLMQNVPCTDVFTFHPVAKWVRGLSKRLDSSPPLLNSD